MKNRAFTLIELLVVVLIIGILAAIAVPQYQKAVLKADIHRGVSLVESLYQAQQAYFLAHGDFATDIDELDVSIPKNESCTKISYAYDCDYGRIYWDSKSVQFQNRHNNLATPLRAEIGYTRYMQTVEESDLNLTFNAGGRYCFAKPNDNNAMDICKNMGGTYMGESNIWIYYELK